MAKYAVVIANTQYADPGLAQLSAPGKDAKDLARVLKSKDISAFDDVQILLNQPESMVREALDGLFSQKKREDLLLLYFSGHGVKDEQGVLYLAASNTLRSRLRSTGIKSDFIRELMDDSRSESQVLILDCCNSGAFAPGTKGAADDTMGTSTAFLSKGRGRVVLTATDSTQYAWEGDKVIGGTTATENSLFTYFLVKGLEGEADQNGDGIITVDELYNFAYDEIIKRTSLQTPRKWSFEQQGEIVLRQLPPEEIKPAMLPPDLEAALASSFPKVREVAISQLKELIGGKNIGLARIARQKLEYIAANDDSRSLGLLAAQYLQSYGQAIPASPDSRLTGRPVDFQAANPANPAPPAPPANQAFSNQNPAPGFFQATGSGAGNFATSGIDQNPGPGFNLVSSPAVGQSPVPNYGQNANQGFIPLSSPGNSQTPAPAYNPGYNPAIRLNPRLSWADAKTGFRLMAAWSLVYIAVAIITGLFAIAGSGTAESVVVLITGALLGYTTGRVLFPKKEFPVRKNMFLLPVCFTAGYVIVLALVPSAADLSSASFLGLVIMPAILGGFGSLGISSVHPKGFSFLGGKNMFFIALSIALGFVLGSLAVVILIGFANDQGGDLVLAGLIGGLLNGAISGFVAGAGIANRFRQAN